MAPGGAAPGGEGDSDDDEEPPFNPFAPELLEEGAVVDIECTGGPHLPKNKNKGWASRLQVLWVFLSHHQFEEPDTCPHEERGFRKWWLQVRGPLFGPPLGTILIIMRSAGPDKIDRAPGTTHHKSPQ